MSLIKYMKLYNLVVFCINVLKKVVLMLIQNFLRLVALTGVV